MDASQDAENYLYSIAQTNDKDKKVKSSENDKPPQEVVDLDMEIQIIEDIKKISKAKIVDKKIDTLLHVPNQQKNLLPKKQVGIKRFATKEKCQEEPPVQKRSTTGISHDAVARIQKVIAAKDDASSKNLQVETQEFELKSNG